MPQTELWFVPTLESAVILFLNLNFFEYSAIFRHLAVPGQNQGLFTKIQSYFSLQIIFFMKCVDASPTHSLKQSWVLEKTWNLDLEGLQFQLFNRLYSALFFTKSCCH